MNQQRLENLLKLVLQLKQFVNQQKISQQFTAHLFVSLFFSCPKSSDCVFHNPVKATVLRRLPCGAFKCLRGAQICEVST